MADILITGGTGFIGSELAKRLVERGDRVHILTRPTSSLDRLQGAPEKALVTHSVDMGDAAALSAGLSAINPQRVFHLASMTRPPTTMTPFEQSIAFEQDVLNLLRLVEALAAMKRPPEAFIRAGTLAEYGAAPIPYREEAREQPLTGYGASMVSGTQHLFALKSHLPFPVISARLALVYGPRQSTGFLIPLMIERCLKGETVVLRNPSEQRDLIYIDDVIDAFETLSAAMPLETDIINICTGVAPAMGDVARLVAEAADADPSLIQTGDALVAGGAAHLVGSPERAQSLLGWRARTTIEKGIQKTVALIREHPSTVKAAQ